MQPLANVQSVPASSISTSSPSSNLAELVQAGEDILWLALNEFPVDIDDHFIMPCNDGPVTCEEQFLVAAMPDSNMCANSNDNHRSGQHRNALHVETDNTNMDCSLETLQNWLDATSLSNMECSDTTYLNTYQYDSHRLHYMNNHVIGHLHGNMGINGKATNSAFISYSPSNTDDNVPMRFSGSAGSGDDCVPALEPNLLLPLSNSEATAMHVQLNLEARSSPPLHSMPETRAKERVSILVESSTPALDDGYRWCKYGQKNIKDQIHPRCYFRCAQHNCLVKKQTESSSNMQGYVLITYFGKHNH